MNDNDLPGPVSAGEPTSPFAVWAHQASLRADAVQDDQHSRAAIAFSAAVQDDVLSYKAELRSGRSRQMGLGCDEQPIFDREALAALVRHVALSYYAEPRFGHAKPSIERAFMRVRNILAALGLRVDGQKS